MKNNIRGEIVIYTILLALLYMPLFGHLNTLPIRTWDEARVAVNALEMYETSNYLIPTYNFEPEMWNTKPPLLLWFQNAWMHLIGINELAIRLPSAIASFVTCICLLFFCTYYLKQKWLGILAIIILITTDGYIDIHASRTGDYDALLTMFTTLYCLSFYIYLNKKQPLYLYVFFICIGLAVLTKSITAFFFLPGIFIYALHKNEVLSLIKNKHFYIGSFLCIALFSWYYLLREQFNPGYLFAVYENELGGRFLNDIENNSGSFWYYLSNIVSGRFCFWFLLIPGYFIFKKSYPINNNIQLLHYLLFLTISFLLIISLAQTKLTWYDVPIYPLLALLIAIIFYQPALIFLENSYSTKANNKMILGLIMLSIFYLPYSHIFEKTYKPQEKAYEYEHYRLGYFLKDAVNKNNPIEFNYICFNGYYVQNEFYTKLLSTKENNIKFIDWKKLNKGEKVIASQNNIIQYIQSNYNSKSTVLNNGVVLFEIE